jgi:hypothetical protein
MRYINSVFALRLLNISLCLALGLHLPLLWDICKEWHERRAEQQLNEPINLSINDLRWKDVDIRSPPNLNDTMLETYRLNEFLARSNYKCADRRSIGTDKDSFLLCYDPLFRDVDDTLGKTLVLTGLTYGADGFERELNSTRWSVYIPQENTLLDKINGVVDVHYLTDINEEHHFSMDQILESLREETEMGITKIELYSQLVDGQKQQTKAPEQVDQILPFLRTRQLLLTIHVDNKNAVNVIPEWYRLLHKIVFDHHFALLGAESNGACGRSLGHCQYRITLIKTKVDEMFDIPAFGLGSPTEERLRLLSYLSNVESIDKCVNPFTLTDEIPFLCEMHSSMASSCSVVYIRYRLITDATVIAKAFNNCQTTLCYPEPNDFKWPKELQVLNIGLATTNNESKIVPAHNRNSFWHLKPLHQLVKQIDQWTQRNVLAIDMDGGEWDVLEALTDRQTCGILKRFSQITFRLRIWAGEENRNYRRYYLWFLRLEYCGFIKALYHCYNRSTHFVIFNARLDQ